LVEHSRTVRWLVGSNDVDTLKKLYVA
jgi:hypothetical protein